MDRKLIGIISVMLAVCILILTWVSVFPVNDQNNFTSGYNAVYDHIFDKNKVIDIYVTLSESDFDDMMQNPTKEEYKQAAVVVDGEKIDNVGFRVKGNSSLKMVAESDSDRYSFKVDFDQYIKGQNLAGLTKLNLNNSMSDPSYMREYLSYSLLNEMGILTPAYCYANVYVNGELVGLYMAVEGIEEPFLKRYYGSNYGTLYKPEGQGSDLVYIDDNMESYSGISLVTEPKNSADAALIDMIKALNKGVDLDKHLDIDEVLRYFAVNTVLVNMDSYQGNFKHNYYLYEEDGVFSILPWDYNMSFGGFMGGGIQNSTSLYIDQPLSGTTMEERPLIGKLLEVEEYKELYHQYIEEFINGPFALDKMNNEIGRIADLIRPHLDKDPTKFYTMEQFEQAMKEGSSQQNIPNDGMNPAAEIQSTLGQGQSEQGVYQQIPDGGEGPPIPSEALPAQDRAVMDRRQRGGDMMQGNNAIGLAAFIQERISNVSKQLSGELSSVGDTSQAGNFMDGQRGGLIPQGDGRQRPPDMEIRNPPGGNGFRGEFPGEFSGNMDHMGRNGNMQQTGLTQYITIIGGSMLLLFVVVVILFKKKTKYSI